MSIVSNNDIARAIYLVSKEKEESEQIRIIKNTVNFLYRKRLLSKAPDILSCLSKIINEHENTIVAKVFSATQISGQHKTQLEEFLKKRYSARQVVFNEVLDKKLLGGLRIEVNDEVIDLSVKNKIAKLQDYLIRK